MNNTKKRQKTRFRFIDESKELTKAEKTILSKMFDRAGGFDKECKIKLAREFDLTSSTIAISKKKLIQLNIIEKSDKPFTYKINEYNKWLIENIELSKKAYDRVEEWIGYVTLIKAEAPLLIRIMGSINIGKFSIRKKYGTFAKELNTSKNTITRQINKLVKLGLIKKTHTDTEMAHHRPAKYSIRHISWWDKKVIDEIPPRLKLHLESRRSWDAK